MTDYENDVDENIALLEQFMLDQEMSSKYAAQRVEDDYEEEENPPELTDEDEEKNKPYTEAAIEPTLDAIPEHTLPAAQPSIVAPRRSIAVQDRQEKPYNDYFLKYPLLRQKSMTITLSNGQRMFCAVNAKETQTKTVTFASGSRQAMLHMKAQFDPKQFLKIESQVEVKLAVERRVAEALSSSSNNNNSAATSTTTSTSPGDQETLNQTNGITRVPFVKKYAPSRFVDLLSHEKRNRDALKWLKSFDKHPSASSDQQQQPHQPIPKILLLAGPPGSGKTTMCHVLAKHAGYRAVEINASDERSAAGLKEKIQSATEMKSVFDQNGRTNLVILDEIDGISDGVHAVVNYANSASTVKPIICTCNDAYVPSLRPLRRIAMVMTVNLPSRARLVKRLREVCQCEQIDYRPGALELLATRMDDDIRASLNALDFWKRSSSSALHLKKTDDERDDFDEMEMKASSRKLVLDMDAVQRLPAFAKDGTADLWSTWRCILQRKSSSSHTTGNQQDLLPVLTRHMGDLDVVVDGIHENFLRNRFMDPSFTKTFKACEWLSFVDVIQTRTMRDMDFTFASYCAAGCAGVGKAVSGSAPGKMLFPLNAGTFRAQKLKNEDAIVEFLQNPRTRSFPKREIATDVVPALLGLLVPHVRPIPFQALSAPEKVAFERVVALLSEFDLSWVESADFQFVSRFKPSIVASNGSSIQWSLDPPIDKLVTFNGERSVGAILSEHARALNSRMKKKSQARGSGDGEGFRQIATSSRGSVAPAMSIDRGSSPAPESSNDSSAEEPKKRMKLATPVERTGGAIQVPKITPSGAPSQKRDFFGRVITTTAPVTRKGKSGADALAGDVSSSTLSEETKPQHEFTFRFNEGLTDAVRRVVKIQELM